MCTEETSEVTRGFGYSTVWGTSCIVRMKLAHKSHIKTSIQMDSMVDWCTIVKMLGLSVLLLIIVPFISHCITQT